MKREIWRNFLQNPPAVVWISVICNLCACNASVTKQRSFSSSKAECPDINKEPGITLFKLQPCLSSLKKITKCSCVHTNLSKTRPSVNCARD